MAYEPQFYPGNTIIAENRRKHMSGNLEKLREISDEDLTLVLGHRAPGSDYPSTHPPLAEMGEPECSIRELVEPTEGAKAGDRVRYVQFADSMYNAPATPYFRAYYAAIKFRGVDPGTLSGRQVVEARERDMEKLAKESLETEISCPALSGLRGATVHGHSLRLQEDGVMFDMLDRRRLENGTIIMDKDQVGRPLDKKVDLGKPMSEEEAAKRTTIYRVDNVAFRDDDEAVEWVHRVWETRTEYGFQPKVYND
ncbi:coenzyme-B sulfoethylthiotransferase subunit gamma [Methanosalsum natronophilum]|uniref:Methyl-coenzyme M reductase subunit gamma n=1 Tax=Methanosalsum natronophilum TaxID=768733 RepID=A0A3R7VRS6_9EURY|nr:coenzyme-B sulfoethylthiotransferase subunit gamma [Methanosalsum natronophilum]MCS3924652.1 methyl-coenzyme M reductase gamma subunit [Methanosalsum natronophilum]RQD82187.1 MAG: coenzyme-B sulfoethylthiotransferase subunit gamma [Methanosalsum natronophilum]